MEKGILSENYDPFRIASGYFDFDYKNILLLNK